MSELVKKILEFFESKAVSMPNKMIMLIIIIGAIFLVDNLCGFSYYFVQSYKLDYITSLEDARFKYSKDNVVSQELDRMMVNALNRWTIYDAIFDIFQNTSSTTSEAREQKLVEKIVKNKISKKENKIKEKDKDKDKGLLSTFFPVAERSPFWHTICSSLFLVFLTLVCIIYVICSPFIKDNNKRSVLWGMCIVIPTLICGIFFTQWMTSFIPDIDGRPRINNTFYVCLNIIATILLIKRNSKKNS